jgi:hypothetical protein
LFCKQQQQVQAHKHKQQQQPTYITIVNMSNKINLDTSTVEGSINVIQTVSNHQRALIKKQGTTTFDELKIKTRVLEKDCEDAVKKAEENVAVLIEGIDKKVFEVRNMKMELINKKIEFEGAVKSILFFRGHFYW